MSKKTAPKTAHAQLAELKAKAARLHAYAAEQDREARAARAAVTDAQDALHVELARLAGEGKTTSPQAEELTAAVEAAQAKAAEPWSSRIAAAQDAARQADVEVTRYVNAHLRELLEELRPQAEAARNAITAAAAVWHEAKDAWHSTAREVSGLLRHVTGIDGQALPLVSWTDPEVNVPGHLGFRAAEGDAIPLPLPSDAAVSWALGEHEDAAEDAA